MQRSRTTTTTLAALAIAVPLTVGAAEATRAGGWERPDLTVKLEAGDVVSIVGGPETEEVPSSKGGTSAAVYSSITGRYLGDFTTEIQDGPDIGTLLGTALSTGTARAAAVDLTLDLRRGTLREQHTANVAVLAEPPSTGYEFVVAVVGEGVVQPGTGIYEGASGTSSLHLVFEVDAHGELPPVLRSGTLRFDID